MRRQLATAARPALALAPLLAGCATVDPAPDYARAAEEIRSTTGAAEVFDPEAPVLSAEEIRTALADGLCLEEATRLALLNNRRLQAGFLALGVARADYVQSGLLRNPSLGLAFFLPEGGGRTRWTADLAMSVSELWEMPLRQEAAGARVDRQVLDLASFAGELVYRTREAYFETASAREAASLAAQASELARRSRELVGRQVQAGMATRIDESLAASAALEAELSMTRTRRDEVEAARRLAALLSLEQDLLGVALSDSLPWPASAGLAHEDLVERCRRGRPDLRAAERGIALAEDALALERRRRLPEVEAGLSAERPEAGSSTDFLLGPNVAIEIPLFDQNQAQVSRAELHLAQLQKEHEALVAEATQEVLAAADRAAVTAETAAFARDALVPQAEQAAALAQRAYELGDALVLALIQAQRALIDARRTETEALLEAVRANLALERALGAPLASLPAEEP